MNYKDTINLPSTPFPMKGNLPVRELEIQSFWEEIDVYEKCLNQPSPKGDFILHDGPPYSNEEIHLGQAMNKILKDIICKYRKLQGYRVPFIPGWDNHGLPIEREIIQQFQKRKEKPTKVKIRESCRKFAHNFVDVQKQQFKRLGVIADWKNSYLTMSKEYEAKILEIFLEFVKKGYIYRGLRPIHWCTTCETALALAEIEYKDKKSYSLWMKFPLRKDSKGVFQNLNKERCFALVWTTTPWTIPANLALTFHPAFDYVIVEVDQDYYILAKELLKTTLSELQIENYRVIKELKGKDTDGLVFKHPIFDRDSIAILGRFVTLELGTGVVHTAPGHGRDDFEIGIKYNLPILSPVDEKGIFTKESLQFSGLNLKDGDKAVIEALKKAKTLLKEDRITHSYPHCWRCKNPVVFRTTVQWFMKIDHDRHRERALKAIENTKWFPSESINRIKSFVESRPDWCLSRQKTWGVGIPAFYCKNCSEPVLDPHLIEKVIEILKNEGSDAWYTKDVSEFLPDDFKCPKCRSKDFEKEKDILDVWFDSGSSHLAVLKPNEIPCDVYIEGSDQHRGWFNTSLMVGIGATGKPPYKSVITHGFTLDEKGYAMHKSAGNAIPPQKIVDKYGADILRLWVASSNYFVDVNCSDEILHRIKDAYRKIRNTFRFLLGNLFDFDRKKDFVPYKERTEIDRWIMHKFTLCMKETEDAYEKYEFYKVYHSVYNFCVITLSSFYLDVSKDRLYTYGAKSKKRRSAQSSMYEILKNLAIILSPILSHTSEEVWKLLSQQEESVLFATFPKVNEANLDYGLAERWERLLNVRDGVLVALEKKRNEGLIGNSLEARVSLFAEGEDLKTLLNTYKDELPSIFIVSQVALLEDNSSLSADVYKHNDELFIDVQKAKGGKCERCWIYSETVGKNTQHPTLCEKCCKVVCKKG